MSTDTPVTLPEGTYRLTIAFPAIHPDKRKRHDWRAAEVSAGTLFCVERVTADSNVMMIYPSGEYSHYSVALHAHPALIAHLEPVTETPSMWFRREHPGMVLAAGTLDVLVASGALTMAQVQEAAEQYLSSED